MVKRDRGARKEGPSKNLQNHNRIHSCHSWLHYGKTRHPKVHLLQNEHYGRTRSMEKQNNNEGRERILKLIDFLKEIGFYDGICVLRRGNRTRKKNVNEM
jgi:hypothetical protein